MAATRRAEPYDRRLQHSVDSIPVRYIGLEVKGSAAGLFDQFFRGGTTFERRLDRVGDDHAGALDGKTPGDDAADAGAPIRDYSDVGCEKSRFLFQRSRVRTRPFPLATSLPSRMISSPRSRTQVSLPDTLHPSNGV